MKTLLGVLLMLSSLAGQAQKDQSFYLFDFQAAFLLPTDSAEIDSCLTVYHTLDNEYARAKCLYDLANNLNNEQLWPKYNELGYLKFKALVAKDSTDLDVLRDYAGALSNQATAVKTWGMLDSASKLFKQSIKISEALGETANLASTYSSYSILLEQEGKVYEAIDLLQKSEEIAVAGGDTHTVASALINVSGLYQNIGKVDTAVQCLTRALKYCEQLGDHEGEAICCNNLGLLYADLGDYDAAKKYYWRSWSFRKEYDMLNGGSAVLSNLGRLHQSEGNMDSAFYYRSKSLAMDRQLNDQHGIAVGLNSMGYTYLDMGDTTAAIEAFNESLEIRKAINHESGKAVIYGNLAEVYFELKQIKRAKDYAEKAYAIDTAIGYPASISSSAKILDEISSALGDWKASRKYYAQYVLMRDSVKSVSVQKAVLKRRMGFEHEKEMAVLEEARKREEALADAKLSKQKLLSVAVVLVLILVAGFLVFVYRKMKVIRSQKDQIEEQKLMVDIKNKEITDSINYAQRIQEALLDSEEELSTLLDEHFILFKPKDIVSGDFYWSKRNGDYLYLIAADCTGHGVPGGFMSMLGMAYLNEVVNTGPALTPATILGEVRDKLITNLHQTKDEGTKDGMDASLIRLNLKTKELMYAGANNPMYLLSDQGRITELASSMLGSKTLLEDEKGLLTIQPDKQPVGVFLGELKNFTDRVIQLQPGDEVCLFSDGFPDQFGGKKGKKYMYKKFKNLLLSVYSSPLPDQKVALDEAFENWRGALEQVDDVCVIGVRV